MAAPIGNKNASKNKPWADSIRKRLTQRKDLDNLADVMIDAALQGDMQAMKEIGDRMDGKPKQQTEVTGADGEPLRTEIVIRESST